MSNAHGNGTVWVDKLRRLVKADRRSPLMNATIRATRALTHKDMKMSTTNDARMIWSIVRKAQTPKLRRPLPVGYAQNGNRKRVLDCACCGASISFDGKWRMPTRVRNFLALHNRTNHILDSFDFDGSLAGMVSNVNQ